MEVFYVFCHVSVFTTIYYAYFISLIKTINYNLLDSQVDLSTSYFF